MKPEHYFSLKTRRGFIRQAACAAVGTVALSSALRNLRLINEAVAQSNIGPNDYKALICVFLNGGNDSNNLIIPTIPSEWQNYYNIRGPAIALPNTDNSNPLTTALALNSLNGQQGYPGNDNHTYGFHPAMRELATLFNTNRAVAPVFNVGTLAYPLTKAQYNSGSVPKPPQLFSHSDQQTQWQTALPDQPAVSGWGGRVADLLSTPMDVNAGGRISMAVTLAGSNTFQVGNNNAAPQYSVTTSGAVGMSGNVSGSRLTAMQGIVNVDKVLADRQTKAYAKVLDHAMAEASILTAALGSQDQNAQWFKRFPSTVTTPNGGSTFSSSLMNQMKMVARLIEAGSRTVANGGLGMRRQIFFIQVGGYDTHTQQTTNSGNTTPDNTKVILGQQANLLAELSQTLNALYLAMSDLSLANKITAFTVSDFARTFPGNGDGSDHGWGGHHIVMGGAVKGGATYGKFPTLAVNGPDDTSTGRWIPTTSVDQYAATLATWFGVDNSNLSIAFPNLGRFASPNLGFV